MNKKNKNYFLLLLLFLFVAMTKKKKKSKVVWEESGKFEFPDTQQMEDEFYGRETVPDTRPVATTILDAEQYEREFDLDLNSKKSIVKVLDLGIKPISEYDYPITPYFVKTNQVEKQIIINDGIPKFLNFQY